MSKRLFRPARGTSRPPLWLMTILTACTALNMVALMSHQPGVPQAVALSEEPVPSPVHTPEVTPSPAPTATPIATPQPTPEPTPLPEPDWSQAVAESEAVEQAQWFSDAVFIGDSRTDGFHLYSGITTDADFLDHTGLSVYDIMEGKKVIRRGETKYPILELLAEKQYGKVYVALGVNELGYFDPNGFAATYGQLIDAIRACQENAAIYVQAIIPVNSADCKAHEQRYYVTNEAIVSYNEALSTMAEDKQVYLLNVGEALVDETGELSAELSADGVHLKRAGYERWLTYLTTHTGQSL